MENNDKSGDIINIYESLPVKEKANFVSSVFNFCVYFAIHRLQFLKNLITFVWQ